MWREARREHCGSVTVLFTMSGVPEHLMKAQPPAHLPPLAEGEIWIEGREQDKFLPIGTAMARSRRSMRRADRRAFPTVIPRRNAMPFMHILATTISQYRPCALPANISRIMKRALPPNAKIAKDAKETVQECVSEYISFITSEASDKCQQERRKTINGDDLLWAMRNLGFEMYIDPLTNYLNRYREAVKEEKPNDRGNDGAGTSSHAGFSGSSEMVGFSSAMDE